MENVERLKEVNNASELINSLLKKFFEEDAVMTKKQIEERINKENQEIEKRKEFIEKLKSKQPRKEDVKVGEFVLLS
ncbi:MAG: hypothetical protein WC499_04305 [Patescibacteria group bacterium]